MESLIVRNTISFAKYDERTYGIWQKFNAKFVDEIKGINLKKPYEKSKIIIQKYNDPGKKKLFIQTLTIQRIN
jgi:hypothetical protein